MRVIQIQRNQFRQRKIETREGGRRPTAFRRGIPLAALAAIALTAAMGWGQSNVPQITPGDAPAAFSTVTTSQQADLLDDIIDIVGGMLGGGGGSKP